MKKVLIYGSKEFGQVIKDLVIDCGHEFCGFIDDFSKGNEIVGNFEYVKSNYSTDIYNIVIAVGYNNLEARWIVYENVCDSNFNTLTLIHPKAYVSKNSELDTGSIVMAGVIIDTKVNASKLNVFWPGVVVNHDTTIGSNNFFSPNSTICGCCTIGSHCFIGAGAVIVDHNIVLDRSFVKANSTFYNDSSKSTNNVNYKS